MTRGQRLIVALWVVLSVGVGLIMLSLYISATPGQKPEALPGCIGGWFVIASFLGAALAGFWDMADE